MRQLLTFINTTGREATGLRASFGTSRSIIEGEPEVVLPHGGGTCTARLSALGAEFRWSPPLPSDARVHVRVAVRGAPLCPRRVLWRVEDGRLLLRFGTVTPHLSALASLRSTRQLPELALATYLARLEIGEIVFHGWRRRFHCFFWDFDGNTNPVLMRRVGIPSEEMQRRAMGIFTMVRVLDDRLLARLGAALEGRASPTSLPASPPDDVRSLSTLQLGIFRKHFPGDCFGIHLPALWAAFLAFSNGELRIHAGQPADGGEPDGGQLFAFAEFAVMAVEADVDADAWRVLARPLIAMQESYAAAYRPNIDAPTFVEYCPRTLRADQQVDAAFKRRLRRSYERMGWADLLTAFGRNAASAFPGGVHRME